VKNFPHQVNKLERFAGGLRVLAELRDVGADLADDGVVGDALARAGVYTFRDEYDPANIEELLEEEHAKPASNQGTRTMARELRRTFLLLGLISESSAGFEVSDEARTLITLQHDPLSPEARAMWQAAFRELELTDESGTSHPYELMLRLVGERPGIETALLGLALEPTNDSEAQFQRILDLVDRDSVDPAWDRLGVSVHQRRNSVKILPAVARQLGDIEVIDHRAYLSLPDPTAPRTERERRQHRAIRSRRRRYDRNRHRGRRPQTSGTVLRTYDPDLLAARYAAHEACLAAFDSLIPDALTRWEGDYDLLIVGEAVLLLAEVKTIRLDAHAQTRVGLGQLLYYEHFDVRPEWPEPPIHRLLVLDAAIDHELLAFLDEHEVGVVWRVDEVSWGATDRARAQLSDLGVNL
jgi:hypothetical protein